MEYTTLASTGLEVSKICFGTWRFAKESDGVLETDRETAHDLLDTLEEHGCNFIDTANVYGDPNGTAEEWIGDWMADRGIDREELVIASKVYGGMGDGPNESGLSRKHIRDQIEGSLDRLGTDYIDLYYIHRWDDETPIRETMRTLSRLVQEGKVHYIGASSMAAWKLTKALWTADLENLERFEVTQPRYNPVYRDEVADYIDVCADQGIAVCPYSPLEGGFLTGKYERDGSAPEESRGDLYDWEGRFDDRQWATLAVIESVAEEVGATPAQVTLRWMMDRRRFTCIPIIGARSVDQLEENLGAVDVSLSADQRERITEAYD